MLSRLCCCFLFIATGCPQNHCRGADGDDGAIVDAQTIRWTEKGRTHISAGAVGAGVADGVDESALAVAAYIDDTVGRVHARIHGFNGRVDIRSPDISAYHIVAHL